MCSGRKCAVEGVCRKEVCRKAVCVCVCGLVMFGGGFGASSLTLLGKLLLGGHLGMQLCYNHLGGCGQEVAP